MNDRDLRDSAVAAISPDTQLGLAYNAALQAATIALAASGYRASRERKHYMLSHRLPGHTPSARQRPGVSEACLNDPLKDDRPA